jgi:hypothetical protein
VAEGGQKCSGGGRPEMSGWREARNVGVEGGQKCRGGGRPENLPLIIFCL